MGETPTPHLRLVLAPDKFKGCLGAPDVCAALARGIRAVDPSIEIDHCPMADGGEGTVDALVRATGGRFVTRRVTGPLPEMQVDATFGLIDDDRTAVIEMASASGLHLLRAEQHDPMRATTAGTGELLNAAAEMGVSKIILGIGGSATTDGGVGCAEACRGFPRDIEMVVACDVNNPLFGPDGAAFVYAPQKGATPQQVRALDARLRHLADAMDAHVLALRPGAGAAGGLGFGMMAFFNATLRPGVEIVIEATWLRQRLSGVDLCLTGEGKLDEQSRAGKVPIGVARVCGEAGVPCAAIVGSSTIGADAARSAGLHAVVSLVRDNIELETALRDAPRLIAEAAQEILRHLVRK